MPNRCAEWLDVEITARNGNFSTFILNFIWMSKYAVPVQALVLAACVNI
jgi:hypothetical protein